MDLIDDVRKEVPRGSCCVPEGDYIRWFLFKRLGWSSKVYYVRGLPLFPLDLLLLGLKAEYFPAPGIGHVYVVAEGMGTEERALHLDPRFPDLTVGEVIRKGGDPLPWEAPDGDSLPWSQPRPKKRGLFLKLLSRLGVG